MPETPDLQVSTEAAPERYHLMRFKRDGGWQWDAMGECDGKRFDVQSPIGDSDAGYDYITRELRRWRASLNQRAA